MAADFVELAEKCAPEIGLETLAAVVSLESGFHPFAIRINSGAPLGEQPATKAEAIEAATALVAAQQDVQLGLGAIGSSELARLRLTLADAFDPCLNLKATATLLTGYYRQAIRAGRASQEADRVMLQAFFGRGDASVGAIVRYDEQVRREVERLSGKLTSADATPVEDAVVLPKPADERPWNVFASGRSVSVLVFRNDEEEQHR
ncbi:VirB1 type IV secretion protein (plasmid) [Sinorhizobium fredii NGR234]|uniref:VirB1 type IV secretion protein n=1 Tax=Sinorhizobium fredii (strain NBRC 101917 / NGR234) TaxID=394 RepID=C3KQX0_SINFN|nr:transglycosylase SLT domain-containing protein [Sinorhizobium fredii]ACP22478.1 VirB1 type IV secretion protein [Sinorhizobium fredii NGR234]